MYLFSCDYCPGDRALLLILVNGKKVYMCSYCANKLDDFVKKELGEDIYNRWAVDKNIVKFGNLEELTLRALIKEMHSLEKEIFEIQKKWFLSNVNEDVKDKVYI